MLNILGEIIAESGKMNVSFNPNIEHYD